MKKFSITFILSEIAILMILSLTVGLGLALYFNNDKFGDIIMATLTTGVIVFSLLAIFYYIAIRNLIIGIFTSKTERRAEESGFANCSTFHSNSSVLKINSTTGKIAYISSWNPLDLQIIPAKDITKIRANYIKEALGGTRYVFFEFYYQNKRFRIPTFTANSSLRIDSGEVQTGLSKADAYCEILEQAKQVNS